MSSKHPGPARTPTAATILKVLPWLRLTNQMVCVYCGTVADALPRTVYVFSLTAQRDAQGNQLAELPQMLPNGRVRTLAPFPMRDARHLGICRRCDAEFSPQYCYRCGLLAPYRYLFIATPSAGPFQGHLLCEPCVKRAVSDFSSA